MTTKEMTTSAVVYCSPSIQNWVTPTWVAIVSEFFASFGLSINEFAVDTSDNSYEGLFPYYKNHKDLDLALARRCVSNLGLYCNPKRQNDLVMNWYGLAYADLEHGNVFLGVPQVALPSLTDALTILVQQADLLTDCSYGIAYYHERLKGPDFFAVGIEANADSWDEEAIRRGRRIARWMAEMGGSQRYLRGWFRGAYPASLLSDNHLNVSLDNGIPLSHSGLGQFTPVSEGRWLWELDESEIPLAEAALERAGVLVK